MIDSVGMDPKRIGQPARLFWAFAEPFLTSGLDTVKQRGRIPRDVLNLVWHWIGTEILPGHFPQLEADVRRAVVEGSVAEIASGIVKMKRLVGPVLKQTLLTCEQTPAAIAKLNEHTGSPHMIAHLRDMSDALEIEPILAQLHTAFAVPIIEPEIADIEEMSRVIAAGAEKAPQCVDMIYVGAMSRFANPAQALRLAYYGLSSNAANDVEESEFAVLAEVIVFDLLAKGRAVLETHKVLGWSGALIESANAYCEFATGIQREILVTEKSKTGLAIADMRAQFATALTPDLEAIPRQIATLFSALDETSDANGPDTALFQQVSTILHASVALQDYAKEMGIDEAVVRARRDATSLLEESSSRIIEAIRSKSGSEREHALSFLGIAVDLTEKLQGREVARVVRRLGEAAATVGSEGTKTAAA